MTSHDCPYFWFTEQTLPPQNVPDLWRQRAGSFPLSGTCGTRARPRPTRRVRINGDASLVARANVLERMFHPATLSTRSQVARMSEPAKKPSPP